MQNGSQSLSWLYLKGHDKVSENLSQSQKRFSLAIFRESFDALKSWDSMKIMTAKLSETLLVL